MMSRLRTWFLTGVIVTAPIGITIWLTIAVVNWVDTNVVALVPSVWRSQVPVPIAIPGMGVLLAIVLLTLIGFLTANFVGRWVLGVGERLLARMPVVRSIYGALKQVFETVLASSSNSFRQVVLTQYPRAGAWTIAFVAAHTGGEVARRAGVEMISVFVPTTPNPTSGFLLFVPRDEAIVLDMGVEEAMRYIVSVGTAVPPDRGAIQAASK